MATKVTMEALSPTMEEGRLVKWTKNEGDPVASGDVLAEVETDKAVMELVARGDGVLRKRLANEGDASPVGTLLAVIAAPDANIDLIVGAAAPAGGAAPAAKSDTAAQSPAPNKTVADTKETAGASAVPQTPAQSQGEASTPPQQKTSSAPSAPPARPAAPRPPSPPAAPRGNGSSRPSAPQAGDVSAPRHSRADLPASAEFSSAESREAGPAVGSSSATSRTQKRPGLPAVARRPQSVWRLRATSRMSLSLRSGKQSRAGFPSRMAPSRLSFSPRSSTRHAPPSLDLSSRKWATSTRRRSTTLSSRPWRSRSPSTPRSTRTGWRTRSANSIASM